MDAMLKMTQWIVNEDPDQLHEGKAVAEEPIRKNNTMWEKDTFMFITNATKMSFTENPGSDQPQGRSWWKTWKDWQESPTY